MVSPVCSADGPGAVAFSSGDLAEARPQVTDQNLRRLRADRESLRDHRDADEGRLEQQLGKGRQMRRLPASPAFARRQRARQDQPVVLGEALAGAGFDDREPLPEVFEGSPGPLLRPQAAEAKVKTRKMGLGAAAGAQMQA